MDDMVAKSRHVQPPQAGSSNHNAKLSDDDIVEIRRLIDAGEFNTTIGKMFGVNHSTISNIRRGKSWGA